MSRLRKRRPQLIVVDLSRGSIKLAAAEMACEAVRFEQITVVSPPREGESGHPVDDGTLSAMIRQEVDRNGWKGMRAACLLSQGATSTQSFVLPAMPDADLRQAIELQLSETLHFSVDSASYDYRTVREFTKDGDSMVLTLVSATPHATVMRALKLLREAGLRPVAVSAAAESLANLTYHARLCTDGQAALHVDIGDDSTILNLFENRLLRFSREIDTSSDTFTRALMRPILTPEGPLQLTRQQAEEVKTVAGCPRDDETMVWPHDVRSSEILPLLEPVIQRLSSEVERSVEYMRGLLNGAPIENIVLSGPASRMRNLAPMMSDILGLKVTLIDPIARACAHWHLSIRDPGEVDPTAFSAILGYSLGAEEPINLIPREERIRLATSAVASARRRVAPFAVAGAACVALAAIPILGHYESAETSMRFALSELRTQHDLCQDYSVRNAEAIGIHEQLISSRGPGAYWLGFMKELSAILPESVQITSLSADQMDGSVAVRLDAIVHSGRVPFEVIVIDLTVALGESPFFSSAHIVNATASSDSSDGHIEALLIVRDIHTDRWEETS